ncbi:MAG: hypothetical protein HGA38_04390 [Candidatus Moranbacteria bacterium]|nr:hypothetical protein [Candidatus Moranbacteria bacterium]NTW46138.1 hypothetical protein [Candidatus Moranbacteria bacterium]
MCAVDSFSAFFKSARPVLIAKWWKYIPLSVITIISVPLCPIPGIPVATLGILKRDIEKHMRKRT